mmetsp:Transcript_41870/g.98133  ORF Transcript_41870/g.98133 Transcript_41870/m.98133 type:complete len:354 (-) Transcript_41870:50-1111(-)
MRRSGGHPGRGRRLRRGSLSQNYQKFQRFLRPVPGRNQNTPQAQERRRLLRPPRGHHDRIFLLSRTSHPGHRAAPTEPLRIQQIHSGERGAHLFQSNPSLLHHPPASHSAQIRARPQPHPLRHQARKHSHGLLQPVPGQAHRLRKQLLHHRPLLLLHTVTILPRPRGAPGPSLRRTHRSMVPRLRPGRALLRTGTLPQRQRPLHAGTHPGHKGTTLAAHAAPGTGGAALLHLHRAALRKSPRKGGRRRRTPMHRVGGGGGGRAGMLRDTGAQSHQLGHQAGVRSRSDGADGTVQESGGTGPFHGFRGEAVGGRSRRSTGGRRGAEASLDRERGTSHRRGRPVSAGRRGLIDSY